MAFTKRDAARINQLIGKKKPSVDEAAEFIRLANKLFDHVDEETESDVVYGGDGKIFRSEDCQMVYGAEAESWIATKH